MHAERLVNEMVQDNYGQLLACGPVPPLRFLTGAVDWALDAFLFT